MPPSLFFIPSTLFLFHEYNIFHQPRGQESRFLLHISLSWLLLAPHFLPLSLLGLGFLHMKLSKEKLLRFVLLMGGPWGTRAQALSLGTVDSLSQSTSPQDRLPPRLASSWLLIH